MEKSLDAVSRFKNNLSNANQHSNGDESFLGRIIYSWNGLTEQETLSVTLILTTFDYGNIRIEDGELLNTDTVHMDFNPNFQDYEYSSDGFLIIKGNSPKVGGEYIVKIVEV